MKNKLEFIIVSLAIIGIICSVIGGVVYKGREPKINIYNLCLEKDGVPTSNGLGGIGCSFNK